MSSIKGAILFRIYLVFGLLCAVAVLILAQAMRTAVAEGEYWREKGLMSTRIDTVDGERGNIYSADGELLATSLPFFNVYMDPTVVAESVFETNLDSLCALLSQSFPEQSKQEFYELLKSGREAHKRYLPIQKQVNYIQLQEMKGWPIFRAGRFKGGLIAERVNKRIHPYDFLAMRTLGYKRSHNKKVGLEGSFDDYLKGTSVPRSMYRGSSGDWVPLFDDFEMESKNGYDIQTTVDMRLQDITETALSSALHQHKAEYGTAIVMEVETGQIKAIANLGRGNDGDYYEKYNYAIGRKTEPGSTFKIAPLIALLEDGYVTDTTIVNIEDGKKQYHDQLITDASWYPHNDITVRRSIEISSNVGISKLVDMYYGDQPHRFYEHLSNMLLTDVTGIEIEGEPLPTIKSSKDKGWTGTSLPFMSIGHELELTPLQLLSFFNAIANEGVYMKPYLVTQVSEMGEVIERYEPYAVKRICSGSTARVVSGIMRGVVEYKKGTAHKIYNEKIPMACKTGTAKIAKNKSGYKEAYQASIAGFFPADDPKYSCIVSIYAPREGGYYGGSVAGPVFKRIAERCHATMPNMHEPINTSAAYADLNRNEVDLPMTKVGYQSDIATIYDGLGISNEESISSDWVRPIDADSTVLLRDITFIDNLVPNVLGMGLRDALYVLENSDLRVKFTGKGKVRDQSPKAGTRYKTGNIISLELK